MKSIFTVIITCFITQIALSQDNEVETLETEVFSIEYPTKWEMNNSGQSGTEFIILSPRDGEADTFQENVNLIIQEDAELTTDLDEFAQLSMTQIIAVGAKVIEREQGGDPLHEKIVFNMSQSGYELRLIQYYWVLNGKAYVLTLTCLQDQQEEYWEAGQKVLQSFKIK